MEPTDNKEQRYELRDPLGAGGQGRTYRALDRQTGQEVAVKVIHLRGADGWKPFDLFERECQVLRTLDHPGIPSYLDTFAVEDEGKYCLVLELVQGETLAEVLKEGRPLPVSQLWNYLHQALEVLAYLHGLRPPVIHRDVKPANLICRPDGRLVLVDFGGVRVALRPEGGSTVVGTFGYMAPEQLHGQATPATDIYSLGATVAALAAGQEADKLPRKGLQVDLTAVMESSPLRDLLARMLEPDPDKRLASVDAVRQAATDLQGAEGAGAGPEHGSTPAPAPGPDDATHHGPLKGLPGPLLLALRLIGSLGYVGLVIVDAVFLPLIFALLNNDKPERQKKLNQTRSNIRKALRNGRQSMKSLARGRDPYHADHRLPPGKPRRRLPRGRDGHRRGGRRGRR